MNEYAFNLVSPNSTFWQSIIMYTTLLDFTLFLSRFSVKLLMCKGGTLLFHFVKKLFNGLYITYIYTYTHTKTLSWTAIKSNLRTFVIYCDTIRMMKFILLTNCINTDIMKWKFCFQQSVVMHDDEKFVFWF